MVLGACGVLLGATRGAWQVPHEDASMALEGSSEEANEAARTRATSGMRLLANMVEQQRGGHGRRRARGEEEDQRKGRSSSRERRCESYWNSGKLLEVSEFNNGADEAVGNADDLRVRR